MPVHKDESGKRWVEMEFITPGTPEQVWHAMATGPGNAAWFTKATIEERAGGRLRFHFGGDANTEGEVTEWQPPARFSYVEREWMPGAPPVATEITITPRKGGQCTVRMVHSLFASSDDWDDQLESFEKGWPGFFEVLRLYLTHSPGAPASSFMVMTKTDVEGATAWKELMTSLGLTDVHAGEPVRTSGSPEVLTGTLERVHQDRTQRYVLIRLEGPAPGVASLGTYEWNGKTNVSVTLFFHGSGAADAAASSEPRWKAWLQDRFPAAA
jgi:uncharacterized protein YndB with AHSA1/START domain